MVNLRDDLRIAVDALSAHKLRAALTVLGLTMGVATLMTVMTLVQGANLYVEQKIANLGTNVFRVAKTPFAVVDFTVVVKALKNKNIDITDDPRGGRTVPSLRVRGRVRQRHAVGAVPEQADRRHHHHRLHAEYGRISTRARWIWAATSRQPKISMRRYVCLIGASLVDQFFPHDNPIGPHHPHRQPGIHGDRNVSRSSVRCWARIRTTSSSFRSIPT